MTTKIKIKSTDGTYFRTLDDKSEAKSLINKLNNTNNLDEIDVRVFTNKEEYFSKLLGDLFLSVYDSDEVLWSQKQVSNCIIFCEFHPKEVKDFLSNYIIDKDYSNDFLIELLEFMGIEEEWFKPALEEIELELIDLLKYDLGI